MTRTWMLGGLACLLCAAAALAERSVVTMRDGTVHEGEVTEKGDSLEILTRGKIPFKVLRSDVASVRQAGSLKAQFDQRMAKLKADDAVGRIELARWAFDKGDYSLALDALDAAIAIDPNNEEARSLHRNVQAQQAMQRKARDARRAREAAAAKGGTAAAGEQPIASADEADAAGAAAAADDADAGADADADANDADANDAEPAAADDEAADDGAAADPRAPRRVRPADDGAAGNGEGRAARQGQANRRPKKTRLVTAREINRIRQLEWQEGDKVTVRFENDVKRKFVQGSEFTPQEFNKLPPARQGLEILRNGSRRLHRDVIVASDPAAVAQYKTAVQKVILPGCATSECHGGNKAGDFRLHNPAAKDPETYTNYLLIQQYTTGGGGRGEKDGEAGDGDGDEAPRGAAKGAGKAKGRDEDDQGEEAEDAEDAERQDGRTYKMIDRLRPEDSLLASYGLPQAATDNPHPDVPNFKPIYKGTNDPRYRQLTEWMGETLAQLPPEYNIDLTKPAEDDESTTRPARGRGGNRRPADDAGDDDAADGGARPRGRARDE